MATTRRNSTASSGRISIRTVRVPTTSAWKSLSLGLAEFPDPVVVADNQHRIVFMNHAAQKTVWLWGEEKIILTLTGEIFQVELDGQPGNFIASCLSGQELNRTPLRLRTQTGDWLSLSVTANIIRDPEGKTAGCLAVLRDLQADLMAQPEIRNQIALLDSILRNFPTPFFIVDKNLNITSMNPSLEMLTGYSRQEAVGRRTCADLLCTTKCNTEHMSPPPGHGHRIARRRNSPSDSEPKRRRDSGGG